MLKSLKKNKLLLLKNKLFDEKQAILDEMDPEEIRDELDDELEEDEFDELEYTGPDEGEVYERFDKIKKSFKTYVNSCKKNGYLDDKTIKARQKFSENISELKTCTKTCKHYDGACSKSSKKNQKRGKLDKKSLLRCWNVSRPFL